jgi:glycosyltransferase involved in cell wall biosynthesis
LFIVNDAGFFVSHRLPIALAARAQGYDVHVATPDGPGKERILSAGLTFHAIPLRRGRAGVSREVTTFTALVRLYRAVRPDLVHHVTIKPVLYGSMAARITGLRAVVNAVPGLGYVFLAGGFRGRARRSVIMALYRLAFGHPNTWVIFQNRDDSSIFTKARLVTDKRAILIRGSGVDLGVFTLTPEPEGPITIVCAARLLKDKGIQEFVDAARLLRARGTSVRCVLVGDVDPDNPASCTTDQVQAWVRDGIVEWWGHRTDMPAVFRECHIVCLPSYREGVPKVLLEAAACGRPIVTTDVPGCRDVIQPGETGLLVPARSAAAIAEAIHALATDTATRVRFGVNARRLAASFDIQHVVDRTLAVYRSALA